MCEKKTTLISASQLEIHGPEVLPTHFYNHVAWVPAFAAAADEPPHFLHEVFTAVTPALLGADLISSKSDMHQVMRFDCDAEQSNVVGREVLR